MSKVLEKAELEKAELEKAENVIITLEYYPEEYIDSRSDTDHTPEVDKKFDFSRESLRQEIKRNCELSQFLRKDGMPNSYRF